LAIGFFWIAPLACFFAAMFPARVSARRGRSGSVVPMMALLRAQATTLFLNILHLLDGDSPRHRTDQRVFLFALPHFQLFSTTPTEMHD
jgi:hypothetical protein